MDRALPSDCNVDTIPIRTDADKEVQVFKWFCVSDFYGVPLTKAYLFCNRESFRLGILAKPPPIE